jgi:hypothetical protein
VGVKPTLICDFWGSSFKKSGFEICPVWPLIPRRSGNPCHTDKEANHWMLLVLFEILVGDTGTEDDLTNYVCSLAKLELA